MGTERHSNVVTIPPRCLSFLSSFEVCRSDEQRMQQREGKEIWLMGY